TAARSPLPARRKLMPYRIAGIDVHKKSLAVVVSNVEIESEFQFERRMFGSNPEQLRSLAAWLLEQEVEEVVMESTAQVCRRIFLANDADSWEPKKLRHVGRRRRSVAKNQSTTGSVLSPRRPKLGAHSTCSCASRICGNCWVSFRMATWPSSLA